MTPIPSNSDTPLCDAQWTKAGRIDKDFARELERQLTVALLALKAIKPVTSVETFNAIREGAQLYRRVP